MESLPSQLKKCKANKIESEHCTMWTGGILLPMANSVIVSVGNREITVNRGKYELIIAIKWFLFYILVLGERNRCQWTTEQ